jgi:hypothetical protein
MKVNVAKDDFIGLFVQVIATVNGYTGVIIYEFNGRRS